MRVRLMAAACLAAVAVLTSASTATADEEQDAAAVKSPGVGSGNLTQVPVHTPVNVFEDSVNVLGLLNPAFGNHGVND
ncbi:MULTISPECIES: chaplin [unclassified Streptomyces]|uniref:Chaplin n=1 Tax=Streptomyces sp. NBC_00060 TaxID=2975636 RepID=A0AAU2GUJ0_9ACTN